MRRSPIQTAVIPVVLASLLGAVVLTGCNSPLLLATCSKRLVTSQSPPIADSALTEISGIAASRVTPGILWVHNDSGDTARIFALDQQGATRATLTLSGASANDWEDIAIGPGPVAATSYIYAGDIGDNNSVRSEIVVYRVLEPVVDMAASISGDLSGVDAIRLRYPDGAHNAESLVVDPISKDLVIITKSMSGGAQKAYRVSGSTTPGVLTTMEYLATVTTASGFVGAITGADISPSGLQLAVRTYGGVAISARQNTSTQLATFIGGGTGVFTCPAPAPSEGQGEAIGFNTAGSGYTTVAEGSGAVLHRFTAP